MKSLEFFLSDGHRALVPKEVLAWTMDFTNPLCHQCKNPKGYSEEYKCCTYQPVIPNFFIGASLLKDPSLILKLETSPRVVLTGIGLAPHPDYVNQFNTVGLEGYGQNKDLSCVFYHQGQCGVYEFRNSVCSAFTCGEDDRLKGFLTQWEDYLLRLELGVAQLVLLEQGWTWMELYQCIEWINNPGDLQSQKSVTPSFYKECYAIFLEKQKDFTQLAQAEYQVSFEKLKDHYLSLVDIKSTQC